MSVVTYTVRGPAGEPVPTEIIQAELAMIMDEREGGIWHEIDLRAIGLGKPMTRLWEIAGWEVVDCPSRPWKVSNGQRGAEVIPFPRLERRT